MRVSDSVTKDGTTFCTVKSLSVLLLFGLYSFKHMTQRKDENKKVSSVLDLDDAVLL